MEYWSNGVVEQNNGVMEQLVSIIPILQYSITPWRERLCSPLLRRICKRCKLEEATPMTQDTHRKRRNPFIDTSFLIFAALALVAGAVCYSRGKDVFFEGVNSSLSLFLDIALRLSAAFLMAGFVEVLVPKDLVTKWIGEKSGIKGILIATVAGVVTPGGPMISFPLIAALYRLGADFGPLVGYLTSWELMGIQRIIVWEIPFMGIRFASLRFAVSLLLPIIAGLIAQRLGSHFRVGSK